MRKEFLKKLLYITISTFAVLVLLEISSIFISGYAYQKHGKDALRIGVKYSKDVIIPTVGFFNTYSSSSTNYDIFARPPVGLEYTKSPITVFGCSFAFGHYLKNNQTFSYKLSKLTQRPVYNRAVPGEAFAEMYHQVTNKEFYDTVKPCDNVFYIIMFDHYRRLLSTTFEPFEYFQSYNYKYDKKQDKLVLTNYLPIYRFLNSSYLYRILKSKQISTYLESPKNADELTDLAVIHLVKTKEELEKNWNKKINFIVITYQPQHVQYYDLLKKKLEQNGFVTTDTDILTKENLDLPKYQFAQNLHPTEEAWELLTPLIVSDLHKKGIDL